MLSKSIGTNIKQFRTEKGLSQDALANSLFVTRQTVSNYETGRSHPDLDMLQKIADALHVDVLHLLYGKPVSAEKRASKKKLLVLTAIFLGLLLLTAGLFPYTWDLYHNYYISAPHILVRLILIPLTLAFLGAVVIQVIDYFLNIGKQESTFLKAGRITTVSVLAANLLFVLPYIIWCCFAFFQVLAHHDSISMTFPRIPVYDEIACFFLMLMYKYPYVYIFAGMSLWLFCPHKRID